MAYRSFANDPSVPPLPADSRRAPEQEGEAKAFAPLEQTVIALAEADPVASIGVPGRFTGFFERWFGFRRHSPLPDARLEALRRFAGLARLGRGGLPADEVKRFLAAGFSLSQARALQRRGAHPAR